jgi:hypothetical protein
MGGLEDLVGVASLWRLGRVVGVATLWLAANGVYVIGSSSGKQGRVPWLLAKHKFLGN